MNGSEAKDWIPDRRHCDSAGLTTEVEVRRILGNGVGFRLFSEERRHLMRDRPRKNDYLDVHQVFAAVVPGGHRPNYRIFSWIWSDANLWQ